MTVFMLHNPKLVMLCLLIGVLVGLSRLGERLSRVSGVSARR